MESSLLDGSFDGNLISCSSGGGRGGASLGRGGGGGGVGSGSAGTGGMSSDGTFGCSLSPGGERSG